MKHNFILIITLFFALTTRGQNIYDFLTIYGYENYVENPQKLLAQNKIIKETIYDFKSLQPNSDSLEAEQFFYDEGGYGLKMLRVRLLTGDSSRYTYNSSNLLNDVTTWSCCRNIGAKQVTRYYYDKRSGDYSKISYDELEPEKVSSEVTYKVNKKEFTQTISRYYYSGYSEIREKKLSGVEIFKYNKDWYLTDMESSSAGKVEKKYTFALDKNNKYLKGEKVSLIYNTDKTDYIFDNQNRVVKMVTNYNNKTSVREFLYNDDGTIFQETLTRKEAVSVRRHYYTKL